MPVDPSAIEIHRVRQFADSVFHVAQQESSRLLQTITRIRTGPGKEVSFDGVGTMETQPKTTRLSKTQFTHQPRIRRWVKKSTENLTTPIDHQDELDLLHDPKGPTQMQHGMAHGRGIDRKIVDAFFGNAYEGEDMGNQVVAYPQVIFNGSNDGLATVIPADYVDAGNVASGTPTGMVISKLRVARRVLAAKNAMRNTIGVDGQTLGYVVYSGKEMEEMLETTQVTSADYNVIRALVNGELNTFMGFQFIQYEDLPIKQRAIGADRNLRRIPVYTPLAMAGFLQEGLFAKVSERNDLNHALQCYTERTDGFARIEDEHILEIETYVSNV